MIFAHNPANQLEYNCALETVKSYLSQLESSTGGTVNLATMFNMQFHMQIM